MAFAASPVKTDDAIHFSRISQEPTLTPRKKGIDVPAALETTVGEALRMTDDAAMLAVVDATALEVVNAATLEEDIATVELALALAVDETDV